MKQLFCWLLITGIAISTKAQLVAKVVCGTFMVDVIDGKLNGLKPNARWQEVKDKLPCFTSAQPDGDTSTCGAGLFFKDKDLYFFTDRHYIEIREKFQGTFTTPGMGASRSSLFATLGNPKVKDDNWDAFVMSYGTLVLHYNKAGKVNLIQMASVGPEMLHLCDQSPN